MANKQHVVRLSPTERSELRTLLAAGRASAHAQRHARILLKCDAGAAGPRWSDARVAEAVEVSARTVARVRARFTSGGVVGALGRKRPDRVYRRKLDDAHEARLVAIACTEPPAGRVRWSLRLLANRLVELEVVDGISPETVRATLKKTPSSRG
jgi:homeodomain-containing protein